MHSDSQAATVDEERPSASPAIEIRPLEPGADFTAFRLLNEEWITRYFVLEAKDRETLNDPEKSIPQGRPYLYSVCRRRPSRLRSAHPHCRRRLRTLKMAVSPLVQGRGIGRRVLEHAIDQARRIGAKSLFLGSNSRLKSAVHLYESVGFRHVPPESMPPMPYTRANVFMELLL